MKFFTKKEILGIIFILLAIGLACFSNFKVSLRRARDAQRKNDIGAIADALNRYQVDFGFFPLSSSDGKILACEPVTTEGKGKNKVYIFSACEWGKDGIRDLTDYNVLPYLKILPTDPQKDKGLIYFYISNGKRYQIFASLEGSDEDEYSRAIIKRNISCGTRLCNFGCAYGKTPLDKSIEEYENELYAK
jgi:type II secretory pathway pseudopilin PulG